jgi:plastocyanin
MQRVMIPFVALLALAALLLTGQTSGAVRAAANPAASASVTIDNFNFAPNTVTIAVGTTVVWTNQDDVPHNVTNPDKAFKSPTLDTGEKWEYTFKQAGTFNYYCTIHPKMTGKVVVQ